ncbi:hypothetical protein [Couchioplanes caeruleus]|nr:hypothetical protein [Couchioplanes caeruleus]
MASAWHQAADGARANDVLRQGIWPAPTCGGKATPVRLGVCRPGCRC